MPVIYAWLPDKQKDIYEHSFNLIKNWSKGWNLEEIKLDFELASLSVLEKLFPSAHLSGCSIHLNQSLRRQVQNLGLATEYKLILQPRCRGGLDLR